MLVVTEVTDLNARLASELVFGLQQKVRAFLGGEMEERSVVGGFG